MINTFDHENVLDLATLQILNEVDLTHDLGLDDAQCREFLAAIDQRKTRIRSAQAENQIKNLQQESALKYTTNSPRSALAQQTQLSDQTITSTNLASFEQASDEICEFPRSRDAELAQKLAQRMHLIPDLQERAVWRDLVIGHLDAIPLADCTRILLALDKQYSGDSDFQNRALSFLKNVHFDANLALRYQVLSGRESQDDLNHMLSILCRRKLIFSTPQEKLNIEMSNLNCLMGHKPFWRNAKALYAHLTKHWHDPVGTRFDGTKIKGYEATITLFRAWAMKPGTVKKIAFRIDNLPIGFAAAPDEAIGSLSLRETFLRGCQDKNSKERALFNNLYLLIDLYLQHVTAETVRFSGCEWNGIRTLHSPDIVPDEMYIKFKSKHNADLDQCCELFKSICQ